MQNQSNSKARAINKTLIRCIAAIMFTVALPQIFHLFGLALGADNALGASLLPMHLAVMVSAAVFGPIAGLVSGVLSPLISMQITGMPTAMALPYMTVELAAYGLILGGLKNVKIPTAAKVIITQLGGRLIKFIMISVCFYMGVKGANPASVWTATLDGMIGIAIQILLIPIIVGFSKMKKQGA